MGLWPQKGKYERYYFSRRHWRWSCFGFGYMVDNMIQYHFKTFGGLEIECWLAYDPGEMDGDYKVEPQADLVQALVENIDIKEVMDKFWIEIIEREVCRNEAEG